ncbi:hypothetical protein SAMN05445504_2404 [Burkholderia sp. CF099]|nr:hypothetical protein SAMN05445504_2404 [Burkholderia sp. CF099]
MQTVQQTESTAQYVRDRDQIRAELAEELAVELRDAAETAETIQEVFEHASLWMTDAQKQRAQDFLLRHDYRALGKLLCDVHEQLVDARLAKTYPKRVVLWDEAN